MINFRLIFLISKILISLNVERKSDIQKEVQRIYSKFLIPHNATSFYSRNEHDEFFKACQEILSKLQGDMYHSLYASYLIYFKVLF